MWSGRLVQEGRRELVVRVDARWLQPRDRQRGILVVIDSALVDSVAVVVFVATVVSVVVLVVLAILVI